MSRRIFLVFFIFHSFLIATVAQDQSISEKLIFIDSVKSDSIALGLLESLQANNKFNLKTQLEINQRIVARSNYLQKFDRAVSMANEGIVLARENHFDSLEAVFYKMLGISYYFMDRKKASVPYFEKAVAIAHKNNYWELEASCYNNIGGALTDVNQFDLAEPNLLKSIEIMKQNGNENGIATLRTYRVLARLYSESGRPEKAESIYLVLIEKSKALKDTALLCDNLLFYSEILTHRGEVEKALEMSGEALAYIRNSQDFHLLLAAQMIHSGNLAAAGRYKEAFELTFESTHLMRKTFAKDLEKEISEVEVKYNTAQIKRDKEVSEIRANEKQQIYLLSFAALIVVLGGGVYLWNQRKNNRQKMVLQKQRLETLIEGEEKERLRIARDLHDGIVQDLTSIKLRLKEENKNADINLISSDIDKTINEVRNIAYQMMPMALKEFGLIPALEDLMRKVLVPQNIQYEFEAIDIESADGDFNRNQRLPEKVEICLYRVSQEFLNNIVKHSEASFVSFTLSKQKERVTLICEDNGKGFDEQEITKGIGMNGLSTRLEMLNGTIRFESPNNKGTIVLATIPIS